MNVVSTKISKNKVAGTTPVRVDFDSLRVMAMISACRAMPYKNSLKAMVLHGVGVITKGERDAVMVSDSKAVGL